MTVSNRTHTGPAALRKLTEYFKQLGQANPERTARRFSERLFAEGFIVVPTRYAKPARRGKPIDIGMGEAAPSDWIGTAHSANLVNNVCKDH